MQVQNTLEEPATAAEGMCVYMINLQVYEGQVVGIYNKSGDLKINVCKAKALTNMRASQSEKKVGCCLGDACMCAGRLCPGACWCV